MAGWGTVNTGAWGAPPPAVDEDDLPPAQPAQAPVPKFGSNGTSSFRANPVAEPTPAPFAAKTGLFGGTSSSSRPMTDAELRQKEAELIAREKRIQEQEKELGVSVSQKPNWPICYPVWRHDIGEDIPDGSKRVVREAYMCWWFLLLALSWQFFCAAVMLGYSGSGSAKVPSFFLTIIWWVCGVPGAIWLWYKRLYDGAKSDSTVGYVGFFLFFFVHWCFCVFCAIAPQINAASWAFSGFIAGIDAFNVATFPGIIYMIGGALWSCLAIYSMWVLKDAYYFWRGKGGITEVQNQEKAGKALAAFTSQQQAGGNANRV